MTAAPQNVPKPATRSPIILICLLLALIVIAHSALARWVKASANSPYAADVCVIPAISLVLVLRDRRRTQALAAPALSVTSALLLAAGLWLVLRGVAGPLRDFAPALGLLLCLNAVVLIGVGAAGWRNIAFALLFPALALPLPQSALNAVVAWLQSGSATLVRWLFQLLRVPFLQNGLEFSLPGVTIEIAAECSGIRSSFALLALTVLLAHFALRGWRRKLLLVALAGPLMLVKNAVRVVTLTLLATYVDPGFLTGPLHRRGGFVFFGAVLAMEVAICGLLRRTEAYPSANVRPRAAAPHGAASS